MKLVTPPDELSSPLPTPLTASPANETSGLPSRMTALRRRAAQFWLRRLFQIAPKIPRTLRTAGPVLCWMTFAVSRLIRTVTTLNARRILGEDAGADEVERVARGVLANFYAFCCDVAAGADATMESLLARVESIEGRENYFAARASGKGVIVVTAHMGSFEVGLAALRQIESTIHVVFRRDPDADFELSRSRLRERLGVREAPVDEGWTVWMRLRDALMRNEAVVLQGDRVMPGQKGKPVPFLGGHLMLPTGPVKLAAATGSPIVPIFSIRNPDGTLRVFIEPAIETGADPGGESQRRAPLTPSLGLRRAQSSRTPGEGEEAFRNRDPLTRWADVLEAYVLKYPEQWLLLQPALVEDANVQSSGEK